MGKKTVSLVLLVFIIIALAPAPVRAWKTNRSSSYRWVYDHSNITEQDIRDEMGIDENVSIEELHTGGGEAFLFQIEYTGKEQNLHVFDYRGGYYSEGGIGADIQYTGEDRQGSESIDIEISEIDVRFEGELRVKKRSYGQTEAYGVVSQTLSTRGTSDVRYTIEKDLTSSGRSIQGTKEVKTSTEWNLSMEISYDPYLIWLPTGTENVTDIPTYMAITSSYTGELEGEVKRTSSGTGIYNGSWALQRTVKEEDIASDEELIYSMSSPNPYDFIKNCPVSGAPLVGHMSVMDEAEGASNGDIIKTTTGKTRRATWDDGSALFGDQEGEPLSLRFLSSSEVLPMYIGEQKERIEPTTGEEYDDFMEDRQAYLESHVGEKEEENRRWMYLAVILVMFITASTALAGWNSMAQVSENGRRVEDGGEPPERKGRSNRDVNGVKGGIKSGEDHG